MAPRHLLAIDRVTTAATGLFPGDDGHDARWRTAAGPVGLWAREEA